MTMYSTQIDVDCSFQTIDEWEWEKINIMKGKCKNCLFNLSNGKLKYQQLNSYYFCVA